MIGLKDLARGLNIDKSNLCKLIKRLNINCSKVRGKKNQWSFVFTDEDVEIILNYREGIPHNLIKTNRGYEIRK
jgi:hypothetical protein